MLSKEFELKIQKEISPDLYIEDTQYEDLERINIKYPGKNDIYICAFPKMGAREVFDPAYQSIKGAAFPSQEMIEGKIKNFVTHLPDNADLYE